MAGLETRSEAEAEAFLLVEILLEHRDREIDGDGPERGTTGDAGTHGHPRAGGILDVWSVVIQPAHRPHIREKPAAHLELLRQSQREGQLRGSGV